MSRLNLAPSAYFGGALDEILPYYIVRDAAKPDALLLDFLSTTGTAALETGGRAAWR